MADEDNRAWATDIAGSTIDGLGFEWCTTPSHGIADVPAHNDVCKTPTRSS